MRHSRKLLLLSLVAFVALSVAPAHAILLDDLTAGATITVGDKLFSGFSADASLSGIGIEVVGATEAGLEALVFAGIGVEADGSLSGRIIYQVTVTDPGFLIHDIVLLVAGPEGLAASVTESVFDFGGGLIGSADGVLNTPVQVVLSAAQTAVTVVKDIDIDNVGGDLDVTVNILQAVSQIPANGAVPEPTTLLLLGSGLVGLGAAAIGRRRR